MYDDYLKLIGKRVMDFPVMLIEIFSLGVTAEVIRANIGSKSAISLQRGSVDLKFQVEGVAPTNHSSSQKSRLNGIKIWTDLSSVWHTDGPLAFSSLDRVCIACSAVKMAANIRKHDCHNVIRQNVNNETSSTSFQTTAATGPQQSLRIVPLCSCSLLGERGHRD